MGLAYVHRMGSKAGSRMLLVSEHAEVPYVPSQLYMEGEAKESRGWACASPAFLNNCYVDFMLLNFGPQC